MPEPRNIHELKSLQGKLAYLRRLISNLAGKCQPSSRLMKKGVPFEWDYACSSALDIIKSYLMRPPVLEAFMPGKPLILYITAQERSKDVKGQVLADFLADYPIPYDWELTDELPDNDAMVVEDQPPWKMYYDGAAHCEGAGVGVVFTTSLEEIVPPDGDEEEESKLECLVAVSKAEKPLEVLHPTVASWLFDAWRLDVVGPLSKSSGGHLYILAITEYFSKWAEVVSLKEVKKENVANFIRVNIIYHFGIPSYIITDISKSFDNKLMTKIYDLFGFKKLETVLPLERQISSLRLAIHEGLTEEENTRLCLEEL
nr:uncharacterized protein LOC108944507 [Nicotiana tomentosiformis]